MSDAEPKPKFDVGDEIKTHCQKAPPLKVLRVKKSIRYLYLVEAADGERRWLGEMQSSSFSKVLPTDANGLPKA